LDPIANIEHCTVVHCMARNGYEFGIRVSALGDQWFNAPAPLPEGLKLKCEFGVVLTFWQGRFFGNYTQYDVGGDMGDSAITETAGFGAFIIEGGALPSSCCIARILLSCLFQLRHLHVGCRPT